MVDNVAVANFIVETAFVFAYQVAGAVIAISVLLMVLLLFKSYILERIFNEV